VLGGQSVTRWFVLLVLVVAMAQTGVAGEGGSPAAKPKMKWGDASRPMADFFKGGHGIPWWLSGVSACMTACAARAVGRGA
jgi:hypothetical protein